MSLQDSTFNTAHILDNEIVKANDFEFAFEKVAENVAKATQMILESNQDFVINGKVLPYQGMNVKVSPIYGVCKSTGVPFGRTEEAIMEYGFEESTSGRVDIIEVRGEWETYDNQQRAFNDPDTNVQTYQYVDTKKLMRPAYKIKKGVEGSSVAPEVDDGYVKLAEVVIRANNSEIDEEDIKNITADIAGLANNDWTTQPDITYNIGYISDINERFRVQHNEDGTHKDNVINTDSLDIGTGAKQVNGNVLPIGNTVTIPEQTTSASDTIFATISKVVTVVTSIYNSYLKYGTYGFKGSVSISNLVDANDDLVKPVTITAAGDGTAVIKIDGNAVLSIDANGRLSTNGYTANSANNLVTKAVTDAISTSLSNLATRVTNIENTLADNTEYVNKVLSTDRYTVASITIAAASIGNIGTLSGLAMIDDVSLTAGQNVLVKNQTDPRQNGIYTIQTSNWTRPTDYNTPAKIEGKIFNVTNGMLNKGKMYYIPNDEFSPSAEFGDAEINFVEFIGSIAKLANKLVMRDSSGAAKLDITGNVTGDVTGNVTGNAGGNAATATNLKTKRTINGVNFDGSSNINNYVSCSTAAATAEKAVTCPGFVLDTGAEITVKFTVTNTADNPKLNVNNGSAATGAKAIYYRGSAIAKGYLAADRTYTFRYNGTQYELVGDLDTNTTYSTVSKTAAGLCPQLPNESETTKYLRQDGSWVAPPNTTYSDMTGASSSAAGTHGLVPAPAAGKQGKYLRGDGTWNTPTNTTYGNFVKSGSTAAAGLVPSPGTTAGTTKFLCEDATWKTPEGTVSGVKGNSESSYRTGNVNITAGNIGLGNVNNTADAAKTVLKAAGLNVFTCGTSSGTAAKTVDVANFALYTGARLYIIFSNANTAANPTLNVNSTGAKTITIGGASNATTPTAASATSTNWNGIKASTLYEAYYDGTYWRLMKADGNMCGIKAHYFSDTASYVVFTNGLIVQWVKHKPPVNSDYIQGNFPLDFTSTTSWCLFINRYVYNNTVRTDYTSSQNGTKTYEVWGLDAGGGLNVFAIGY